ncbi:Adenylosuccinate synthetase [hydrothermal vent metagenome]|uniref:Adenylosuccinate synthetase n=1 Tax=hydrothermal vent metagenome TaxID=652676 RepID=A0A3B1BSP1_9ZZZZ
MPVTAIVGAQWGDEGKGKIVDMLSERVDIIARYQGGANAGHTVVVGEEQYILHLIPSGVLRGGKVCVIGSGVVLDPEAFLSEVDELESRGLKVRGSLFISGRAHLIMPYHKKIDAAAERHSKKGKIGTTGRGIGPAYSDKAARIGLRVADLYRPDYFKSRIERAVEQKNILFEHLYKEDKIDLDEIFKQYAGYADKLKDFTADTGYMLRDALAKGKNVLAEGAQGAMLDIDHGTYPYVTSSQSIAGGVCMGLGIPPQSVTEVIGIMKAYTTRVGEGPFPTELDDLNGKKLRDDGGEYGATTGRPRRCGWLDTVVGRYTVDVNGVTSIALTKLDVLDDFEEIKICVSYKLDGETITEMPEETVSLEKVEPVYETLPGWKTSTNDTDSYTNLPDAAKRYIARVEELVRAPVSIVSTGVSRTATILR